MNRTVTLYLVISPDGEKARIVKRRPYVTPNEYTVAIRVKVPLAPPMQQVEIELPALAQSLDLTAEVLEPVE